MKLFAIFTIAIMTAATAANAYEQCYEDQFGNEYWFDINFEEHYIYGEVNMMGPCEFQVWHLQGSFYPSPGGIEFELSGANPAGDDDFYCVPCFKLKGKNIDGEWHFMWYYDWMPNGSQPAILTPCGPGDSGSPVAGQGALK